MKDSQNLDVTANDQLALESINKATELLFRKKSGIDELLPAAADAYPNCPLLQMYTAIMFFFSFSEKIVKTQFPIYLNRIQVDKLNARETLHYHALAALQAIDFHSALEFYIRISKDFPQDKIAILMLETCAFLTGEIEALEIPYQQLLKFHSHDPDFLGNIAFLYCHLNRKEAARTMVERGLNKDPHNAWLQHVYAHTLDEENAISVAQGIQFLEACSPDWPKQSRFFEGHNWMHLCTLYLKQERDPKLIFNAYREHIWGKAKPLNFEQNNAFLVLWNSELANYPISSELWKDLAEYVKPFMYDYFTPYLTITAILAVTKAKDNPAVIAAIKNLEAYVSNLPNGSKNYNVWYNIALPTLRGCLAFIKSDYRVASEYLESIYNATRPLGHSDEQRSIFPATYHKAMQLIINSF